MYTRFVGLCVTLALLFNLSGCKETLTECDGPLDKGLYKCFFDWNGFNRSYVLTIPDNYQGDAIPLVVDLHGGGSPTFGSLSGQRLVSGAAFKAQKEGFAVVWPQGLLNLWNNKLPINYGPHDIDDVGFILALIDKLKADFNIDATKVYVTGVSLGGGMTQVLACAAPEVFAAAATVSMQLPKGAANCQIDTPIPMMSFHTESDIVVYWGSGIFSALTAPESFDKWSSLNHCEGAEELTFEKGNSSCVVKRQCAGDAEVSFCNIDGKGQLLGGHLLYLNNDRVFLMDHI